MKKPLLSTLSLCVLITGCSALTTDFASTAKCGLSSGTALLAAGSGENAGKNAVINTALCTIQNDEVAVALDPIQTPAEAIIYANAFQKNVASMDSWQKLYLETNQKIVTGDPKKDNDAFIALLAASKDNVDSIKDNKKLVTESGFILAKMATNNAILIQNMKSIAEYAGKDNEWALTQLNLMKTAPDLYNNFVEQGKLIPTVKTLFDAETVDSLDEARKKELVEKHDFELKLLLADRGITE